MVNGIELCLLDQFEQMRKFDTENAALGQYDREAADKVVDIRHMCQYVITDQKIALTTFVAQSLSQRDTEKFINGFDARIARYDCDVTCGFDTEHRNVPFSEILQQVAIVACDFDHQRV